MVFEEEVKDLDFKATDKPKTQVRIDLEPKRENELQKINLTYSKKYLLNNKKIGRTKLIKMAIDNLIADLNEMDSQEEQLQYLNRLKKEADF